MRFLLLFVAAVIAVFAGIAAMQLSTPEKTPETNSTTTAADVSQTVSTVDVLVAKAPIPAGTVITAAMIDKQPWPEHLVLTGFIVNGPSANIIGKVTRSTFQAREPFISSKLVATTDSGFMAANLPTGMRAITISTDAVLGVAGFVYPGDHVDLVFTHNVPQDLRANNAGAPGTEKVGSADKPGFAEVLVANVPVLAINLRESNLKEDAPGGVAAAANNAITSVAPSSMTLEVNDVQAEKIRLAEKVGTLSIALRSINDRDNKGLTAPADLMSLTQLNLEDNTPISETVKVIKGGDFGSDAASQHVQGGR